MFLFRSVRLVEMQKTFVLFRVGNHAFKSQVGGDSVVSRCTNKLKEHLKNPVHLWVTSTNDDPNGSHIKIECVSDLFSGKSAVQRQKMVYKAIWSELEGPVHAVDSIIAKTPLEAGLLK